jgi:uncharacterized protein YdhG (YjbR/CyaY superfamily)
VVTKPASHEEYLATFSADQHAILETLRRAIRFPWKKPLPLKLVKSMLKAKGQA